MMTKNITSSNNLALYSIWMATYIDKKEIQVTSKDFSDNNETNCTQCKFQTGKIFMQCNCTKVNFGNEEKIT